MIVKSKISYDSTRTDSTGFYSVKAPLSDTFTIDVYAKDYFFETMVHKLESRLKNKLDIELKAAKSGESVDLKNFYFVGNQAVLLQESLPELPKLLRFMEMNPNLRVEIAGHINLPGSGPTPKHSDYYLLSVARAKTIYDYLIKNGIAEERLLYKGYGNWKMRFPNAYTQEQFRQNRRVEIKILDEEEKD